MRSTLWWLGLVFGTLSIVMLIKSGVDIGIASPLQVILEFYQRTVAVLCAPFQPMASYIGRAVGELFGLTISISRGWHDAFVLLVCATGAVARSGSVTEDHITIAGALRALLGVAASFLAALVVGIAADAVWSVPNWVLLSAATAPAAALILFDTVSGWVGMDEERPGAIAELTLFIARIVGVVAFSLAFVFALDELMKVLQAGNALSERMGQESYTIAAVTVSTVAGYAAYLVLLMGASRALQVEWLQRRAIAGARGAGAIAGTFLGVVCFIATNAGLKLAGF